MKLCIRLLLHASDNHKKSQRNPKVGYVNTLIIELHLISISLLLNVAFHHTYSFIFDILLMNWTASSEFGTYRLCEQRRFRRACASAQSRQNLRCSLIQPVSQEEPSDRKPDPWPLSMAGHAQLKFVMTECSKTQIRLTGPNYFLGFLLDFILFVLSIGPPK